MKETHIETRKKRILKHLKKKKKDNEYKQAMEHLQIIKATKSNQPKLETPNTSLFTGGSPALPPCSTSASLI